MGSCSALLGDRELVMSEVFVPVLVLYKVI